MNPLSYVVVVAMAALANAQFGAVMELNVGLSPRYYLGSAPQLARRQTGSCGAGSHSCQDINQPTFCCPDDQYCYVTSSGTPSCCAIGNQCDSTCTLGAYLCNTTVTTTVSSSTTITAASACCSRACPAVSQYQCASSFGGGCCTVGYSCRTSGCATTSTPATTLVTEVPSGCSTNQITCASSIGGGCCEIGLECTNIGTKNYCGSGTGVPTAVRTATNGAAISVTPSNTGMSTGAKAGIGVGVGLGVCLMVAALIWFCMRRRKAARPPPPSESDMTQTISQISPGSGRSPRPRGTGDYFGPAAQAGPYTDPSGMTPLHSPHGTMGRGVPVSPHHPGDIAPPVEIGNSREHSTVPSPGESTHIREYYTPAKETAYSRAELP